MAAFTTNQSILSVSRFRETGVRLCSSSSISRRQRYASYYYSHGTRDVARMMSGVNGGIDYEINLEELPAGIRGQVELVQNGPETPDELIAAAREIAGAVCIDSNNNNMEGTLLPVLVDMLGYNNPVAARIAIEALVRCGSASIPSLITGCGAFNYSVNQYALRALGGIGDASVHSIVTACAETGPIPGVRRAACYSLGRLNYVDVPTADAAYLLLLRIADGDRDWGVRYAAMVGIEQFAALELVSEPLRSDAIAVLRGIIDGKAPLYSNNNNNDTTDRGDDAGGVRSDPTVTARATIALERMQAAVPSR